MSNPLAPEARALVRFLHEAGLLKRAKRSGWWLAGVKDPETVAEHSWRVAVIAFVLAVEEGADPYRTATLAVFHDTGETRTGDVPSVGRAYVDVAPETRVTADQVEGFPAELAEAVRALIDEYESGDSPEARLARDADKLECLIQAREYEAQGVPDAAAWAVSSAEAVQSAAARRIARAAFEVAPGDWWRPFVEGHNRRANLKSIASEG